MGALIAILAIAAIGGGGATVYFATRPKGGKTAGISRPDIGGRTAPAGGGGMTVGGVTTTSNPLFWNQPVAGMLSTGGTTPTLSDEMREVLARTEKRIRDDFNKLGSEARAKGAAAINNAIAGATGINPGISGSDSFDVAATKAGKALGAAGGAAACTAAGVGAAAAPLCAKLGAIVGAYIGKELGGYIEASWQEVREFFKDAGKEIEDAAGDAVREVGKAADKAAAAIGGYVSGWF